MENLVYIQWKGQEPDITRKEQSWYWTVGIISGGVAIASVIVGNYLLALIAVLAGFTVMVAGSRRPQRFTYKLTSRGFMVGADLIPYESIRRFAIDDDASPKQLTLETNMLIGTITASLETVDHRAIRTELLNNNIEEVESLDTFFEKMARWMGM